jgi:hypothetical protein
VAAPKQLRGSEFCTLTEEWERQIIGSCSKLKTMQEQTTSESKYYKKKIFISLIIYRKSEGTDLTTWKEYMNTELPEDFASICLSYS